MAFTQGAPLPDITETTTKAQTAPDYYTNYLQSLSTAGQQATARTADQGIAGLDPLQQQAYAGIAGAAGAYKPGMTEAQSTASQLTGGLDLSRIKDFMNPYQQQVVDEMARLTQQNIQRNLLPTMKAGFVGSGGLGGQRYAGALGQSMADIQAGLTGQQAGVLQKGYSEALRAAMDEMGAKTRATELQGSLAQRAQELGLTEMGALSKAGAERQAYEQSKLDYPLKQATAASQLMRGFQIPTTETQTFKGPKAGAYQTSGLSNLTGLLALLGAGTTGTAADRASTAISRIISRLGEGVTDTTSGGDIDWSYIRNALDTIYGGTGDPYNQTAVYDTTQGGDGNDSITGGSGN